MDSFDRTRLNNSHPPPPFHTNSAYPTEPQRIALLNEHNPDDRPDQPPAFMKGPKRKRLAKVILRVPVPRSERLITYLGLRRLS
jgi:hypothetical protein